MSSTYERPQQWVHRNHWRSAGLRYFSYKFFLQHQFGERVQRVSLDGGFTCPNVDGTVATGGCVFCNNQSFSPSRRLQVLASSHRSIQQQLDEGIARLQRRYRDCRHFIAYFQPATNTYAPLARLRELYNQALSDPRVIGLAIGTRPDCVDDAVLDLLSEIGGKTFLSVEYGMQTIHDRSLEWMNRGHNHRAMIDAVARSQGRSFEIGAHVILGLPGESHQDMLETARELARLDLDAVKLHNLYVVEGTPLAAQFRNGSIQLMDRDSYVSAVVDALEVLPPHTVVQRIGGEAPADFFLAPTWSLDKATLRRAIDQQLELRDSWQGKAWRSADSVDPTGQSASRS